MSKISLKVITPERVLFEGEVDKYIVSSKDEVGDFEVLPRHIPMTSIVGNGKITIYVSDDEIREATMFSGFVVVEPDKSTILVEVAEWPEEIDIERAKESKKRAEERLKKEDQDFNRARIALIRALNRIDLAEKYRK